MFEAVVEDAVFCSEDKPLNVIAVADEEEDVDVYIDGSYYKTVHVYTSPTEVTIWDTVPVSEGIHEVLLEGRENTVKFKIIYCQSALTVYTEKEDGTPLQTLCHAVDLNNLIARTSNLYAEAFGFPLEHWSPGNVLVEFVRREADGVYYWIGTLQDLIDMSEAGAVHLRLSKVKSAYVKIVYDKANLLDWLRKTARASFPEAYALTDVQLNEIMTYNPLLLASQVSTILGINLPIVDAYFTDTELHVTYKVESGVPAVVVALAIFLIKVAAITIAAYVMAGAISNVIKEVRMTVMPQVDMVDKMTEYEKKRLELINNIIEKYPPEQAQKMIEYVNRTNPSLATQVAEVARAPTTTATPILLIVIAGLLLLLLLAKGRRE